MDSQAMLQIVTPYCSQMQVLNPIHLPNPNFVVAILLGLSPAIPDPALHP